MRKNEPLAFQLTSEVKSHVLVKVDHLSGRKVFQSIFRHGKRSLRLSLSKIFLWKTCGNTPDISQGDFSKKTAEFPCIPPVDAIFLHP